MNSFLTLLTTTFITVNTLSPKHVQHTAWSRREYGSSRGSRIVHRHLPRIVNHNSSRRNRSRSRWQHVSLCAVHNVWFWLQSGEKIPSICGTFLQNRFAFLPKPSSESRDLFAHAHCCPNVASSVFIDRSRASTIVTNFALLHASNFYRFGYRFIWDTQTA